MLRTFLAQGEQRCSPTRRRLTNNPASHPASSFRSPSNHLHTSAILQASQRKQHARSTRKLNTAKREERQRIANANRPHVVLGTRPGDLASWPNCDLAKVLIDPDTLASSTDRVPLAHPAGTIWLPKYLGHGVGDDEKKLLFQTLPALSVEANAFAQCRTPEGLEAWVTTAHAEAERAELAKANALATVLDLRNANAQGLAFENRQRIIAEFSEPDNPFDPGRPEVQGAQSLLVSFPPRWRSIALASCPAHVPHPKYLEPPYQVQEGHC